MSFSKIERRVEVDNTTKRTISVWKRWYPESDKRINPIDPDRAIQESNNSDSVSSTFYYA